MMNMNNLLSQAKQVKKMMSEKTSEFNKMHFDIECHDIKVNIGGSKKINSIIIPDEMVNNKEMLEDLLPLAINRAIETVEKEFKDFMGPLSQAPAGLF